MIDALAEIYNVASDLQRLGHPRSGSRSAPARRCRDRRRLAASAQFSQILIADFEKTAAKEFRYDAEDDVSEVSCGAESP